LTSIYIQWELDKPNSQQGLATINRNQRSQK
jgi:hypothetical protein